VDTVSTIVLFLSKQKLSVAEWREIQRRYAGVRAIEEEEDDTDEEEELVNPVKKQEPKKRRKIALKNMGRAEVLEDYGVRVKDRSQWDEAVLLGHFWALYEKWCRSPYREGSVAVQLKSMQTLIEEHGALRASQGVEALFSPALDWVSRKNLGFIVDDTKWSRFVAPAIVENERRRGKGEQAESKVERTGDFSIKRRK